MRVSSAGTVVPDCLFSLLDNRSRNPQANAMHTKHNGSTFAMLSPAVSPGRLLACCMQVVAFVVVVVGG